MTVTLTLTLSPTLRLSMCACVPLPLPLPLTLTLSPSLGVTSTGIGGSVGGRNSDYQPAIGQAQNNPEILSWEVWVGTEPTGNGDLYEEYDGFPVTTKAAYTTVGPGAYLSISVSASVAASVAVSISVSYAISVSDHFFAY